MSATAATDLSGYRVNSDLNRECLPSAQRDPHRKVAWMNAVCLSVLAVGLLMTKEPARLVFIPEVYDPPQVIQIVENQPIPPDEVRELKPEDITDEPEVAPVNVVVVAADPAKVPFAVPVVGATVASTDLRQVSAPPRLPIVVAKPAGPVALRFGKNDYCDCPSPTEYPKDALIRKETGNVRLLLKVGPEGGAPLDVTVDQTSGSNILDGAAIDFVRRNWKFFPNRAGSYTRVFEYNLPGVNK